ncbi:MAG: hypothetical protein WC271_10945 [Bacteroidales bacterium]|jgi:hypothetical protein|nr:hypothetical protein [Tenuifilaceae bacterium]
MSGPKSYSPPQNYSMQVFDGKLNQVFHLQSRLKMLYSEIEGLHVSDSKLNIQFDCKNELSKIKKQIDRVLKALVFDYKGTFGQDTYNHINSEIDSRISELLKAVNECDLIKADFVEKNTDYKSFLSFLIFYDNSNISFDEFKSQITHYLKSNIETKAPEIFKEANKKISTVKFTKPKSKFDFGFTAKFDLEKKLVVDHVIEKEGTVNKIRAEISDKVIEKFKATGSKINLKRQENKVPGEAKAITKKIKSLISNCDDAVMSKKYKIEWQQLTESESLKDIFFFKEMHDSILESEKLRKTKVVINEILSDLSNSSFHISAQTEREALVKYCLSLMGNSSITKNELDEVQIKYNRLKASSNKFYEEDEIKNKEHLFLKYQLILCLENQGYEVMDDLEVIDFEKEGDFLLKIKGQDNYLNLKFKEDGSMRYVFQIPENKEDLSTDQKNMKLHEMKVTCSEFQSILKDLSKMGLKIEMRSEKPVELSSIVSVTSKHKEKLKTKSKTHHQQQLRKKYLN